MRKSKFSESQISAILKEVLGDPSRRSGTGPCGEQGHASLSGAQVRGRDPERREATAGTRSEEDQTDVRRTGARERDDQGRALPKSVTLSAKQQVLEILVQERRPARTAGL